MEKMKVLTLQKKAEQSNKCQHFEAMLIVSVCNIHFFVIV